MPSEDSPDSKQNYSVQEMMNRLRHEGEGSSSTRRKRRTHQPILQAKQRRKTALIIAAILIVVLMISVVAFGMLNRARIEGEIFRSSASRRLSSAIGNRVECDRFRTSSWRHLDCPNIRITGGGAGTFQEALLTNANARMTGGSFFRNEWDMLSLSVDDAKLSFQSMPPPGTSSDEMQLQDPPINDGFRLGITAEPAFLTAHDLRIENLSVSWPKSQGRQNQIQDLRAMGSYMGGVLKLKASQGRWIGGIWPDVPLDNVQLEYADRKLTLQNASVQITEKVRARAEGTIHFTPAGPEGKLLVDYDPAQLAEVIEPIWKTRLFGKFAPKSFEYRITPGTADELVGPFQMDGLVVQNFPGLKALSAFFKNELYAKLEFRQFSANLRRTDDVLIIENISAVRHGECKLTGTVKLHHDGRLEGDLRLALNTIETGLPQFSGEEDGLDIIEFKLGGTAAAPMDTLSEKFSVPVTPAP
jgi:hypothetical protein